MFKILSNETLAAQVHRLVVEAPRVARARRPGQFVIVRPNADSERIPLTVAHVDRPAGSITLIIQAIGATSTKLCNLEAGQTMSDVAGPLGKPTEIANVGHAAIVNRLLWMQHHTALGAADAAAIRGAAPEGGRRNCLG